MNKQIFTWSIIVFIISQFLFRIPLTDDLFEVVGFLLGQYIFALILVTLIITVRSQLKKTKSKPNLDIINIDIPQVTIDSSEPKL
jgi:hypothetical protein